MIKINLSRRLNEIKLSQSDLASKTNISPYTISDMYNEFADRISLKQMDKICEVLECDLFDLLEYIPTKMSANNKND